MTLMHGLLALVMIGFVVWRARHLPLAELRKQAAIGCRILAVLALCAALWAAPRRRVQDVPRQVIYLVDGSASIEASQRSWMARRIASLEARRPRSVQRAVVAFGAGPQVVIPFGREPLSDPRALEQLMARAGIRQDQTNLEAALLGALSTLPAERGGRVILLSDGWETAGNVTGMIGAAQRLGLEVFPEAPPPAGRSATMWDALIVPPVAQRGSPVPLQLILFNGAPQVLEGDVVVSLQGIAIKRQRLALRPGWQVATVKVPALQRGTLALDVHVAVPAAGISEHRMAYTEVEGPPRVLFVSERMGTLPLLAAALKRREIAIAVARPSELPVEASSLLDQDAVLLFNVAKSTLSSEQVGALRTDVERFGGGLVMVGLGGALAHEVTTDAPLDALLPVRFEAKGLREAKRRVCMIMLIDRSTSMLGPRIAATKRGAIELIKQLAPEDLVGVLAFDTQPYVIAEVQPAQQVTEAIVEKLVKLRSSGGTDVYPALAAAVNRLDVTGATVKHIILLSDGNTAFHEQAYRRLTQSMKESHITVSTIGIGSVFINTDYLRWLAETTGGTFYQLRSLEELPQLIARDTHNELGRLPFTEGAFRPSRSPTTDWFAEIPEWPTLRGYLTTTAKPTARVDLTMMTGAGGPSAPPDGGTPAGDPLLARWSLGQGRVVAFASDAETRWSPEWIRWNGFEGVWAQIVRWAMRPRLTESLFTSVEEREGRSWLVLAGEVQEPRAMLIAPEGAEQRPLSLVQMSPWRWEAPLEDLPSGWYQLAVESQAAAGDARSTRFAKRWVQVGTPPVSREEPGQVPRETLLQHLAAGTGGVYGAADQAFVPPTTRATTTQPVLVWWLPLAILALLLDIALRGPTML